MKKDARFLILGLTVWIMALMAGCNSASVRGDAAAPQPVTLRFTTWAAVSEDVLNRFHAKYPYITVEHEQIAPDRYDDLIRTRLVTKQDMDLVWLDPSMLDDPPKLGALVDWNGRPWLQRYSSRAIDAGTVYGNIFGIPYNYSASVVFYNQDLFDRLHLQVPDNWEELMAVCAKLKENGIVPFVFGGKDASSLQYIVSSRLALIHYLHPDLFRQLYTGEKKWTGPEFDGLFDQFQELFDKHYVLEGKVGFGYEQIAELFKDGKAAMWASSSAAFDQFPDSFDHFRLGVFPIPANRSGEPRTIELISTNYLAGITWSKHPDEVEKFMEFLSEPDIAALYSKETKTAVTVKDATPPDYHPLASQLEEQIDSRITVWRPKLPKSIEKAIWSYLQDITLGSQVPSSDMREKLQEVQNKNNE